MLIANRADQHPDPDFGSYLTLFLSLAGDFRFEREDYEATSLTDVMRTLKSGRIDTVYLDTTKADDGDDSGAATVSRVCWVWLAAPSLS